MKRNARETQDAAGQSGRFVGLFVNLPDAVLITSPEGRILEANAAAERLFGYTAAELASLPPGALFAEAADREPYRELLDRDGAIPALEVVLRRKDGSRRTCLLTSTVRRDIGGAVIEYQDIVRDVTEKREQERWLAILKRALDVMQTGVTVTGEDRHILYVNHAEARMHGYEPEELIGRHASILGAAAGDAPAGAPRGLSTWERVTMNRRKDGTVFPVSLYSDPIRDDAGNVIGLVTSCQDMSDVIEAEETIRTLSKAVEQSSSLVVITDADGQITYVNPAFEKVTGFTLEEARDHTPRVLKSGLMDDSVYEELWRTVSNGGFWTGEFLNRKKGGGLYWCIATISGVTDENGVITHYVGIQQDITLRKRMEQELREKNVELERLNRFKNDAVAITAHDLKSPVNAMISVGMLLRDMGDAMNAEKRQRALDQLIEAGQRLQKLIGHVLDAEKFEAGRLSLDLQETDLAPIVHACVETASLTGLARGLTVSLDVQSQSSTLLGDPVRLEQVFNNLLGNAVKFSPDRGEISVLLTRDHQLLEVSIMDQGPGIPPGEEAKIFDRYYQVEGAGQVAERGFAEAGLGLYISRQLVELHGGTIRAENRPEGTGARFVVTLPAGGSGPIEIRDKTGVIVTKGRAR